MPSRTTVANRFNKPDRKAQFFQVLQSFCLRSPVPAPAITYTLKKKKKKWKFEISAEGNSVLKLNYILLSEKNPSCTI